MEATNKITFKSGRKMYQVTESSEFMDNGACIQFYTGELRNTVIVPKKEWKRLQPVLRFKCYRNLSLIVKIYSLAQ